MNNSSSKDNSSDSDEDLDAFYAAHNLLIDSVILPEDTRSVINKLNLHISISESVLIFLYFSRH